MTYIKLFLDLLDALEPFDDAERGRLLTAMLEYASTGEAPELQGNERFLFPMIRKQIDRDKKAFDDEAAELHRVRSEAGKKGGQASVSKRKQNQANQANASKTKQTQANQAEEEDKEEEKEKEFKSNPNGLDSVDAVVEKWNSLPDGIAKVSKIQKESTRDRHLRKRIRDYGLDEVLRAIDNIRNSDFLQGENDRGWVITFDWFIRPENFQKVLDGNYTNRSKIVPISTASYDINAAAEKMRTTVPTLKRREDRR